MTVGELLLPRTDAGAVAQAVTVVIVTLVAIVAVRRERALVVLAAGLGTVILALMGVRMLH